MYLYEAILNIIEQYGPVDITFLTEEINRQNLYKRMVPFLQEH
jgi:replicative DNA helicase